MVKTNKKVISLPPLRRVCTTIGELPSAYTESMTYYEQVMWLTNYIAKTVIPAINNNAEMVEELKTLVLELEEYVAHFSEGIDEKFEELTEELVSNINTRLELMTYYINTKYDELNDKIDNIIIGNIEVYDPTTGLLTPIQVVINHLFDMNRTEAITALEFDNLELTATEFDAKEITAYDFDYSGKTILTA